MRSRWAAALFLACGLSCSREDAAAPAPALPAEKVETAFSRAFEPDKFREKYSPHFTRVAGGGGRSGVKITPPDHTFKDFTLRGPVGEEKIGEIVAALKTELLELARSTGAQIVREPGAMTPERLGSLPYGTLKDQYSGGLQGFHFAYRQAAVEGAVDVLAGSGAVDGKKEWMLIVSVHEAR